MSNLPQVQGLTLNQSSLLQSLRHAFAGKGSLVLELVQNARRAGATRVSVDYDEKNKTLIVADDGHGIKDPNLLFAIGDSGWDEQVRETDKPFGVGLLSAVYQAQHMDIRSGTLRIQADTQALLEGGKPTVEQMAEPVQGTTIILNGVGYLPMDELPWRLAAFPIPVIIDGKEIKRPKALDENFLATPLGKVRVSLNTSEIQLAAQGILVGRPRSLLIDEASIIHLDPAVAVRFPDRTGLVDEASVESQAWETVSHVRRASLAQRKEELGGPAFFEAHRYHALQYAPDLLNDIELVDPDWFEIVTGYPNVTDDAGDALSTSAGVLTDATSDAWQQITRKGLRILDLGKLEGPDYMTALMFAKATGDLVLNPAHQLHPDHWLHRHVKVVDEAEISVEAVGAEEPVTLGFSGDHFNAELVICDSAQISLGAFASPASVADNAFIHWSLGRVGDEIVVYQPRQDPSGQVVAQMCDFLEDDRYDEAWHDRARQEHVETVAQCLGGPAAYLQAVLRHSCYGQQVRGKAFAVRIDEAGKIDVKLAA